jgi:recombination protein RecA
MARPPKSETVSTGTSAREIALAEIEKSFGKGAIFRMNSNAIIEKYPSYGTGILGLDIALGAPIPKGRIIEIYGPESSGKTTLTLHIAANVQKTGGTVAFVDAEHALDLGYAQKLGVNVGDLDISQPDCGEQALDIADLLVKSNAYNLVIIDSVAALTPRAELAGDMGDSHMGLQARLMSQALRKLTGSISRSNCTVIFINQLRMKIGVMFGNPETTTGGNALKFYASQRMDVRKTQPIKVGEEVVGYKTKIKIIKNKMAPPFKEVELDLLYGQGFDPFGDLLDKAVQFNLIQKSGSWYALNGEKIGQGREQVRAYLKAAPEIVTDLTNKVLACVETGELPIEQD